MRFTVVEKDQLVDLCAELAQEGNVQLASLCDEAERAWSDDEGLELMGDFLVSASFDDR